MRETAARMREAINGVVTAIAPASAIRVQLQRRVPLSRESTTRYLTSRASSQLA
jgi:hypothetical protein